MDSQNNIINISSSEDETEENDIEIIEVKESLKAFINNPDDLVIDNIIGKKTNESKKFTDLECPICFDEMKKATVTSCGHLFCLECIMSSISNSYARGQVRGRHGIGLCPICRKKVSFKDTILLKLKKAIILDFPKLNNSSYEKNSNDINLEDVFEKNTTENSCDNKTNLEIEILEDKTHNSEEMENELNKKKHSTIFSE